MERHALLHRIQHRRQLSRRMTARPSLLTYVTGHNPLSPALNPQSSVPAKLPAPPPSQPYIAKPARLSPPEPLKQLKQTEQLYDTAESFAQHLSFENESSAALQDDTEYSSTPNPDQAIEQTGRKDPSQTTEIHHTDHTANTTQKQQQIKPITHVNKPAANRERNIARTVTAHDELPANPRFAAHNTTNDEAGADIVGAGAVEDEGWGPLRSPVVAPTEDGVEHEPLRSPVVAQNDNGAGVVEDGAGREPSQLPVVPQTHDRAGHEPSSSPVVAQNNNVENKDGRPQGSTSTNVDEDGRPQGSPPLLYDATSANLRFAAHDTATNEGGTDIVGADEVGWGPLRSPIVPDNHENQKPVDVHQARPRRGRIEERPASTMSTNSATPTAQGQQTNTPSPKKPEPASRAKGTGQSGLPSQPNKTGKQEQPKSQAQIEADALFQSNGESTNRTPQQWLAMLMKAERGKQPDEPTMPDTPSEPVSRDGASPFPADKDAEDAGRETHTIAHPTQNVENAPEKHLPVARPLTRTTTQPEDTQAEPLSQQTRQFLRPLVGYDPANARVHRSASAARFAASHNAQAVTTGDDIALSEGHRSDTPETLGLLAHELTHVARQHTPGFVPPVANNNGPVGAQFIAPPSPPLPTTNPPSNEEGVAEQVEQHAIRQARGQAKQTGNSSQWGGLPAPWEPLPDWLASSPTTTETQGRGNDIDGHRGMQPATMDSRTVNMSNVSNGNGHAAHTSTSTAGTKAVVSNGNGGHSASSANGGNGGNGGGVQRAGNERSMNITAQEVNEPSRGQQQNNSVQEPEPDLDELARQVYTVLKRRLGVERRRMG